MRKNHLLLLMLFISFLSCSEDDSEHLNLPVAEFNYNVWQGGYAPAKVSFSNLSTEADYYIWDFNDGKFSTEIDPTHIFEEAGEYQVNLTSVNKNGSSQFSLSVSILQPTVYKIKNSSSLPIYYVFSYYDDGSSMLDYYEHEVINVNEESQEVRTDRNKITVGFYYKQWFLVANPYSIITDQVNILTISNNTQVIVLNKTVDKNTDIKILENMPKVRLKDLTKATY